MAKANSDPYLRLVLIVSILASFVAFLDGSIVNVALPAIAKDVGGGLQTQQWVLDAYLLFLGSFILIAGSLSDLFGRKKVLSAGLVGFLAASILCGVAPNNTFLIGARAAQGLAGALLVPSSLALIMSAFEGRAQGRAIGLWTSWTGISFIIGPLFGGLLIQLANWRWIFFVNAIPVAVTLFLMKRLQSDEAHQPGTRVDIIGAVLCAIGLGGPVYAFIQQPHYGWGSPMVLWPLIIGTAVFIAFLLYEKRAAAPMLPLYLFKSRNFSVGNAATLAIYAGLALSTLIIILFLQQAEGFSPVESGLSLLPVTIIMFFLSPRFGGLSSKYGPRLFMGAGPIIGAAGFLLLLGTSHPVNYWTQMLPGILLFGLGLSVTVAPLTAAILGGIERKHSGIGSAINNAVARIAGLVAIAMVGLVIGAEPFSAANSSASLAAFHRGVVAMAALLFIGGAISAMGIQNTPKAKPTR
jgi:EmrB/QacA subfamily drug resistance transporter